jgi:hypothetical protein
MMTTRKWLLAEYGPVCAYCGGTFNPRVLTLDHVAPRRGQTAYDRRDNLVLACKACNTAKRDQSPMAFLLGLRTRAANLLAYGAHLSHGLVDVAKSAVGELPVPVISRRPKTKGGQAKRPVYGPPPRGERSPYQD